jgi:hypothetical protein
LAWPDICERENVQKLELVRLPNPDSMIELSQEIENSGGTSLLKTLV